MSGQRWVHPRGSLTRDGWETAVDGALNGWEHTGLLVAELAGTAAPPLLPGTEKIVVPLSGSFRVTVDEGEGTRTIDLDGRPGVFAGPTDVLYLSTAATATVIGDGRVAVATSPTARVRPTVRIPAADTPVELRGAGASSRQVHNFGTPPALDADRLIVCEVITPAENWSSYPPHKHDEDVPGAESRLEEIYYFEAAPAERGRGTAEAAFGTFSAYSSPAGSLDVNAMVRTGDVVLVPHGYHGPAAAAPGYDLYYLNVMAGPGPERAWLISDDPAHAWVRETWAGQRIDERLPFGGEED